jgi:hypothetical protein
MARIEEKVGKWAIRYQCHCGEVRKDYYVTMVDISICDGSNPGSNYICPQCGCVGSYKSYKGRYKWTVTHRFFGNKKSEAVWEDWSVCPYV